LGLGGGAGREEGGTCYCIEGSGGGGGKGAFKTIPHFGQRSSFSDTENPQFGHFAIINHFTVCALANIHLMTR
jgi:hypothetical protein